MAPEISNGASPPNYAPPGYTPEAPPPAYKPARKHEAPTTSAWTVPINPAEAETQDDSSTGWKRRTRQSWRRRICGVPSWLLFLLMVGAAIVGVVLGVRADEARKVPRKTVFETDFWYTISTDDSKPMYLTGAEMGQSNVSMVPYIASSDLAGEKTAHWQIRRMVNVGSYEDSCDGGASNTRELYWIANRSGGKNWRLGFINPDITPEVIISSGFNMLELELNNRSDHIIQNGKTWMWYFEKRSTTAGESFKVYNCASRENWVLGWDIGNDPWTPVMVRAAEEGKYQWWRVWKLFGPGEHVKIEEPGWQTN